VVETTSTNTKVHLKTLEDSTHVNPISNLKRVHSANLGPDSHLVFVL